MIRFYPKTRSPLKFHCPNTFCKHTNNVLIPGEDDRFYIPWDDTHVATFYKMEQAHAMQTQEPDADELGSEFDQLFAECTQTPEQLNLQICKYRHYTSAGDDTDQINLRITCRTTMDALARDLDYIYGSEGAFKNLHSYTFEDEASPVPRFFLKHRIAYERCRQDNRIDALPKAWPKIQQKIKFDK